MILAVAVLLTWVGLALFPVFVKPGAHIKGATLVDADRKPLVGRRVVMRDLEGRRIGVETTDALGQFHVPKAFHRSRLIDNYSLARKTNHTGSGPFVRYTFSPRGTIRMRFFDEGRRPLKDVVVEVRLDLPIGQDRDDSAAVGLEFKSVPLALRDDRIRVRPRSFSWRLKEMRRRVMGSLVEYEAVFRRLERPVDEAAWTTFEEGRVRVWSF